MTLALVAAIDGIRVQQIGVLIKLIGYCFKLKVRNFETVQSCPSILYARGFEVAVMFREEVNINGYGNLLS